MYKKYILIILLGVGAVTSWAQQVTKEMALLKAEKFFCQTKVSLKRAQQKAPKLTLANTRHDFYVFNDENNSGYVIVSGDGRMPDILGYSYKGRFDEDKIPCNMRAWLEGYAEQIAYLRTHPNARVTTRTAPSRENISPLLTCNFDQAAPYNNKCPEVDGSHCYTGCVPTAMAQIMYYYKWPKQTTAIPGYTLYIEGERRDMPDIPITTIGWDNMLSEYDEYDWEKYSEKQIDAISTLMLLCGTAVKVNYGIGGSGSNGNMANAAFRQYFSYGDQCEYVERKNYIYDDWEQMLYDELKSRHPVFYEGYSGLLKTAHAFVVDGYRDGYYHINWGWGVPSSLDGDNYFLLTEVNSFNYDHHAIIGLQPDDGINPSRYAVLDNGKMILYYDNMKANRLGTVIAHKDEWKNYASQITECVFDPSFADLRLRDFSNFFSGWKKLKTISGIEYLNTSGANNMYRMFYDCNNLENLDICRFNTDKVVNMNGMFYNCSQLTTLDLSGFNTENVTNMGEMFCYCIGLENLDVSSFKTDNVTYMGEMFAHCHNLKSLDVSGFKTDNVTDMYYMFRNCSGLTNLDVSNFKTDCVNDMCGMFMSCSGLINLDLHGFDTANVSDMSGMFNNCSSLMNLNLSGFNTENVTSMDRMFCECPSLTSIDLSHFKTDNVTNTYCMFSSCTNLSTIYVSEFWNMSNVNDSYGMFEWCPNLVGGAGTAYDENHIDGEYARIDEGWLNPGYFTYKTPITIGDVNGDGVVTITDAVGIVNKILGNPSAVFMETAADINGDGQITITDAVGVVNIILNNGK